MFEEAVHILKKAAQVAIDNGWNPLDFRDNIDKRYKDVIKVLDCEEYSESGILLFYELGKGEQVRRGDVFIGNSYSDIIFDHDFAKALWSEEPEVQYDDQDGFQVNLKNYEHHLQQMVISEDPFQYLADNIPKDD